MLLLQGGKVEVVALLLKRGAVKAALGRHRRTALELSVSGVHEDSVRVLKRNEV